jgi:hypothetical protein
MNNQNQNSEHYWIPESTRFPNNYAPLDYSNDNRYTDDIQEAIQFSDYNECKDWCEQFKKNGFNFYRPSKHELYPELNFN